MFHTNRARAVALAVAFVAAGILPACHRDEEPSAPPDAIEYRVVGTVGVATVRYSNSLDGFTQVVSGLPFTYTVTSTRATQYLTLDAAATTFGYLQVQIFVNGVVFRDANITASAPTVGVSGTFRRPW